MNRTIICLLLLSFCVGNCDKSGISPNYINSVAQGGSLARFAIVGNYMYTVDDQKLKVYDISNAAEPVIKSTIQVGFEIETIFPFKDRLFIGSTSSVHIFSLADPAKPEKLSQALSPQFVRRCDPVVAKDTVAYATLRTNGPCGGVQSVLAVYDIRNINEPIQKTTVGVPEPYGLGYAGDVLYVCDKSGLLVFDIRKAYEPAFLKVIQNGSYLDVIPSNGALICWVSDGVIIYDITDTRNPVLLTKII